MHCDVLTLFPAAVESYLAVGVLGRAVASGRLDARVLDLRRWAGNRYGQVDDAPFGGGAGMVLMAPVVVRAVREVVAARPGSTRLVIPDPRGRRLDDRVARELAGSEGLVIVCGRYEGFDERVFELLPADVMSIGDYVLAGGELAALVILETVSRHLAGVVGDPESVAEDSFTSGLLDYPVYTRPRQFEGLAVPEVLLSGDHAAVRRWRREQALARTRRWRPDLFDLGAETEREREE